MMTTRLTRAEQKARTRDDIQRQALTLFETRGFEGTTIDDIANAAGIGRRTFFRYFSSKEAVLFSHGVFTHLVDDVTAALADGAAPVAALIAAIDKDDYGSQDPDETTIRRRRLRVRLLGEPAVAQYYQQAFVDIARDVSDIVREHPVHGRVPLLPELVGGLLHTMLTAHLQSGETHHFSVDAAAWHDAVRALERSF